MIRYDRFELDGPTRTVWFKKLDLCYLLIFVNYSLLLDIILNFININDVDMVLKKYFLKRKTTWFTKLNVKSILYRKKQNFNLKTIKDYLRKVAVHVQPISLSQMWKLEIIVKKYMLINYHFIIKGWNIILLLTTFHFILMIMFSIFVYFNSHYFGLHILKKKDLYQLSFYNFCLSLKANRN